MSCNIEKILFNDSLNSAREKINKVYTGSTEIWSGGTGIQSIVSRGNDSNSSNGTRSIVAGGVNNVIGTNCTNSAIIGGENNTIKDGKARSVILGGENNVMNASDSVIVAGNGITATTFAATYVESLVTSGARRRKVRELTTEFYSPSGSGKGRPSIMSDDEIILIKDKTTSATGSINPFTIYSLSFGSLIKGEIGRVVELVLVDNGGYLSSQGTGVILNTSDGSDFKINSFQSSVQALSSSTPYYFALITDNVPIGSGTPDVGTSCSLMYAGDSNGVPQILAWGTGIYINPST